MRDDLGVYIGRLLPHWKAGLTGGVLSALLTAVASVGGRWPVTVGVAFIFGTLAFAGFAVWRDEHRKLGWVEDELHMWRAAPLLAHGACVTYAERLFVLTQELPKTATKQEIVGVFEPVWQSMQADVFPHLQETEVFTFFEHYTHLKRYVTDDNEPAVNIVNAIGWMKRDLLTFAKKAEPLVPVTAPIRFLPKPK